MRYPVCSKPAISLDFTPGYGDPPENTTDLLLKYTYTAVPSLALVYSQESPTLVGNLPL